MDEAVIAPPLTQIFTQVTDKKIFSKNRGLRPKQQIKK
jgi:hypothetical protein